MKRTILKITAGRVVASSLLLLIISVSAINAQTGVYILNGGTAAQANQTYTAAGTDQSGVYVINSGVLTLSGCQIITSGNASSTDKASQYGINAGILAASAGKVTMVGGSISTTGSGANGIFATGSGSSIGMSDGSIIAIGANAHGVDATYGGAITLSNVDITTKGASSSALATDFGGGTVTVTGGTISAANTSSSSRSAGIYSTGVISVTGAKVSSLGDFGGVIDGANSILLTNTSLTGQTGGIKTWKTAPASGAATVTINGGSLTSVTGDGLYVTGSTGNAASANLTVKGGAVITAASGNIVSVDGSSTANVTVDGDTLKGNMTAKTGCTMNITLKNKSLLTGTVTLGNVTMDAASIWILTANSVLGTFSDASGISGTTVTNITGNGFNVYYDAALSANSSLGGKTYTLVNGGVLSPKSAMGVEDAVNPYSFNLSQNYPNPFNPVTTISYTIAKASNVTLTVYNVLGKEVIKLVDGYRTAGEYKVVFNAGILPSGVYFYKLSSGSFSEIRKMVLMK